MTGRLALALVLTLSGALAAMPARAEPPSPDDVRAQFRAALDHASDVSLAPDSAALRGYVLFPYVEAARLRASLARVGAAARDAALERRVREFLKRHGDAPVARELRHDWLAFLGARAAWGELLAFAPAAPTEPDVRCYVLSARLARNEFDGVRDAALAVWLTDRESPPACAPVFQWLDDPQRLGDEEVELRAIYAAQNRLPLPAAVARLPLPRRTLVQFWDRLMERPEPEIRRFLATDARNIAGVDADTGAALIEAFTRLARRDSHVAEKLYKPLLRLPLFDAGQREALKRSLALGLAYDFDAHALPLFRDLPESQLDPPTREWRVRAAILHGEWKSAREWIEAMPVEQRNEARWQYWLGRALERRHHGGLAGAAYERAAQGREYYAFLAAERLRRAPDLRPQALPDDRAQQASLETRAPLARARELFACGLSPLALAELRHGLKDDPPAVRVQAARLATQWGWHTATQQMLAEMQQWDDLWLRYPLPYDPPVDAAAKDTGLPGDWLYAVMRTESLYDPQAASGAGALGLLQLRLATARAVAQRAGLPRPDRDDLFNPEVNIAIAARYLRELVDRFGGHYELTLAAYNAGPQRIPAWTPKETVDADVWVENIPFTETRTYVQRVMASYVILGWRRSGEPNAILPLLRQVGPSRQDGSP